MGSSRGRTRTFCGTDHYPPVSCRRSCEPQQHGQGAFQLAVQVHLVTGQPRQLVGIEGLAKSLRPYDRGGFPVACVAETYQGRRSPSMNRRRPSASGVNGVSPSSKSSGSRGSTSSHHSPVTVEVPRPHAVGLRLPASRWRHCRRSCHASFRSRDSLRRFSRAWRGHRIRLQPARSACRCPKCRAPPLPVPR